jgi:replicative DNA helicase
VPSPLAARDLPEAKIVLLARLLERWPFVPNVVFALTKRRLALFLRHLWATGGCVRWDAESGQVRISYAASSRELVDDVARLLLRFNVLTRIEKVSDGSNRRGYLARVCGAEDQLRFLVHIGVYGPASAQAEACRCGLSSIVGGAYIDTVPPEVWERVRAVLVKRQEPPTEPAVAVGVRERSSSAGGCRATDSSAQFTEPLGQVASELDGSDLGLLATNDVFWDEVASVESIGVNEVYDATVEGTHNFIANGIHLHNSIEQDADVVILLHREDAYEKESPRAGEADFIVAKHRNGPTTTVTVAFQGHYSRFVDMARM